MNAWDVLLGFIALPLTVRLVVLAERWWWWSGGAKDCSNPTSHRRRMAEWQQRIDEAQTRLDYYRNTPNWFDLEWPICDNLQISSDGEYCVRCFRQAWEHAG